MADAIVSRAGQIDGAGDVRALFLKVFAGEVLTAFERETAFKNRHMVRMIASGKSAQFPVTGRANALYHTPGQEITGGVIRHGEKVINIDDMIIAPVFIANIDEAMNHYDYRSIYSNEIGQILAKGYDQNVARSMILAARASGLLAELSGGSRITNASMNSDGTILWQSIFNAGTTLDTKDVPMNDRSAFVRPVQYALIVQSEKPIDTNLNANGDNGSIAVGDIKRINSIDLVKTNNLVSSNDAANTDIPSNLRADFSTTQGVVAHRSAAGTVQLQDVALESAYDIRRQGTLMVGKYLVGSDSLRPEASVELATS